MVRIEDVGYLRTSAVLQKRARAQELVVYEGRDDQHSLSDLREIYILVEKHLSRLNMVLVKIFRGSHRSYQGK